jgi:PIN domain nuclease of toxin-antitoxin system
MIYVLDACAMIALLRGEPGEDVVWSYVRDDNIPCQAHSINLCEVYYNFCRVGGEDIATGAIADLKALGIIERNDFDLEFWQEAGRHKALVKRISLADCFAITLANRVGGVLLTSDHHEFDPIADRGSCQVMFFR